MGRERRAAAVAVLALGCASERAVAPAPAASVPSGVERYLPLPDATVYTYETRSEPSGERGLLILEVRRPRPDLAELVVAGRAQRLTINAHDVAYVTGGYLLREPLTRGAKWKGDFGTVELTNVERSVTLPAGAFSGCIETVEQALSSEGEKRTTTVFCPGVGIASRETEAEEQGLRASERIMLRSFGPRFDPAAP